MKKYKVIVIGFFEPMFYPVLMTYEDSVNLIMEELDEDEEYEMFAFSYYISEVWNEKIQSYSDWAMWTYVLLYVDDLWRECKYNNGTIIPRWSTPIRYFQILY